MDRGASRSAALALALLLAGCGGGGGAPVSSTPTPPVATVTPPDQPTTPTPTTPTPPAPPTANYDDAEYRRSTVAVAAGALTAYNAGATGAGVKIAILDSGLSDPTGQFSGRIDPASRDMVASRGITDQSGHGTSVAGVAAAGRNGSTILGVAFDATVTVLRSDNVGTCASSDGCSFSDTTLAQAIDYARTNGARVINMSLGGASPGTQFRAAIGRATAAGVVVVMSAGNDSAADPDAFAQIASSADANGLVVIAGAHDASGVIASFSDRAGAFGRYYLTALGSGVRSIDETGTIFQFAGTSYSAPAIAGAVALLAQAFPTMTGTQILALLYRTATDAGAAGVDSVYGNGILNLDRAFQPIGTTSLAGSAVPIDLTANAVLGTAMGDAGTRAAAGVGRATILDSFGRAYALDIGGTIGHRTGARPLIAAIGGDVRGAATAAGPFSASITLRRGSAGGQPWLGFAQRGMGREDERAARAIAGLVTARIDPATTVAFGFGQGGAALGRTMDQAAAPALLIARDPGETPGFEARRGAAIAVRRAIGAVALTATAERGTVAARDIRYPAEPGYAQLSARGSWRRGSVTVNGGLGLLDERSSVIGSRFGPALGGGGARTLFADVAASGELGGGWSAGLSWRRGWTRATRGGAMLDDGRLVSGAFAADLGRTGARDRMALRIAQPLRVTRGGFRLALPDSYDFASAAVGCQEHRLDLAPRGREIDAEASYGRRLGIGWIDANVFWRSQPDNIAAAPDDKGLAMRFSMIF